MRYERFEAFAAKNLHISEHKYESLQELQETDLPYELMISGSDQIWNPKIFPDGHFDPVFFGDFFKGRRIAYAPSFGIPRVPDGMETELRSYLERFSHISVRESRGSEIVEGVTGKAPRVVLDPTLLLPAAEWDGMAATPEGLMPGSYILCYCISDPTSLQPYLKQLQAQTGLPVVQLCGIRRKVCPGAKQIFSAGPAEFLGLFRNAACVCTNSFHGTVFSVQFEKPFFTAVAPSELTAPESSRTFSILNRLGLTRRIIGKGDTAGLQDQIDWPAVQERLERERTSCLAWLKAALEDRSTETEEDSASQKSETGLPQLAPAYLCTGCTACAQACPADAIRMDGDREGFLYPKTDLQRCVKCGRCTAVCPLLKEREKSTLPAAYAAWSRDDAVRKDSTSGGVFSVLAEYILEEGGVVYGAALDGKLHVRHVACFRKEDLWRLRGAKYA